MRGASITWIRHGFPYTGGGESVGSSLTGLYGAAPTDPTDPHPSYHKLKLDKYLCNAWSSLSNTLVLHQLPGISPVKVVSPLFSAKAPKTFTQSQGRLYRTTCPGRKSILGPLLPFFCLKTRFFSKKILKKAYFPSSWAPLQPWAPGSRPGCPVVKTALRNLSQLGEMLGQRAANKYASVLGQLKQKRNFILEKDIISCGKWLLRCSLLEG